MLEKERNHIASLMVKRIYKRINPLEDKELEEWLNRSADNRRMLEDMSNPQALMRMVLEYDERDEAAGWDQLTMKIPALRSVSKEQLFPGRPFQVRKGWFRGYSRWLVAAVLLILAGTAVCLPLLLRRWSSQKQGAQVAKQQGKIPNAATSTGNYLQPGTYRLQITLPDGSILDADKVPDKKDGKGMKISDNMEIYRDGQGILVYRSRGHSHEKPSNNRVTTPRGGWYTVVLPDGTRASLNAASSLSFMTTFGNGERNVTLRGEAYFEVANHTGDLQKEGNSPFTVEVSCGQDMVKISAPGTRFNVTAYTDDAVVRATLLKGSIHVEDTTAAFSKYLQAGDQYVRHTDGKGTLIHHTDTAEAAAWKNDQFVFHYKALTEVMQQLGRWYDASVLYLDTPQVILQMGGKRSEPIQTLLNTIEGTGKVHFMTDKNKITVTR